MGKAVIFIPGIKGTKLYDVNTIDNDVLWQDIRFNFEDFERLIMTLPENGKYYDQIFDALVAPANIEPLAYREFWKELSPSYKWKFIFPYDWRLPNEANGEKLHQFIEFIIEKSKVLQKQGAEGVQEITQFDIVTHSMGNFPARYYVKNYGFGKINKIIFVAPPFKGAADAISALTVGQGFFFNKDKTRKMARTLPGVFELLPRYKYSNVEKVANIPLDLFNKNNWQENLVTVVSEKNKSIEKFIANLESVSKRLDGLDAWMDNLTAAERKRILVLAKTEFETFTCLLVEKSSRDQPKNYFNLADSLYIDEGDAVVPNASSCCYYDKIATYAIYNEWFRNDKEHAFLMTDSRVQRIINSFLNHNGDTDNFVPEVIGRTVKKVAGLAIDNQQDFLYEKVVH